MVIEPVAERALEWFIPVMRPFMYSQRPSDRKRLAATWKIANVWFCKNAHKNQNKFTARKIKD